MEKRKAAVSFMVAVIILLTLVVQPETGEIKSEYEERESALMGSTYSGLEQPLGAGGDIIATAGADNRNLIVTTGADNRTLKLDSDGNVLWNMDMGCYAVDAAWNPTNRTIYAITIYNLTKMDSNGTTIWNTDISSMYVPGVGSAWVVDVYPKDGSSYILASGGPGGVFGTYKYDPDGNFVWKRNIGSGESSVAVNPIDGMVYVNSYIQGVFKYDPNGNVIWQSPSYGSSGYGAESIKVNPLDGSVVAAYRNVGGSVVKLNTDGGLVWQTSTSTDKCQVALDPYRDAAYVTGSGYLNKFNLTNGNVIWQPYISSSLSGAVAVDYVDGRVYVGAYNGSLYTVDPDSGSIIQNWDLGYQVQKIAVEPPPCVFVQPTTITGPPPKIGETFNANITIADVRDLYVWQAGMTFNASVLECLSIAEGEFLKRAGVITLWTPGTINNDTGTISYSACSITESTPGVNGTGQLMSITFRVKGSGNSTLHLTDVLLLDSGLTSISPVNMVDGHVEIHVQDISILSVTKSATEAYPTWIVPFNVTVVVENQGTRTETFDVTTYASAIEIGTQEVTLAAGANITLEFNWNLAGVAEATYTIRAEATVLYGEIDTADNTLIEGTVKIKHPGDANDDSVLNAYDLGILAKAWGTSVGDGLYDTRADFNGDGTIDTLDHDILKAYWP